MSNQPWDRLPEESSRWYQRFETFRLLGVSRTIENTWGKEQSPAELSNGKRPARQWYEKARVYKWRERAEAWDKYLSEKHAAEIEARWQAEIMGKAEVLGRLSRMGRANPKDFLTFSPSGKVTGFSIPMLNLHGDLVKKLATKETANGTEFTIELHDGQAATVQMGRYYKLFTDVQEHNGTLNTVEMTMAEWKAQQAAARSQAAEVIDLFDDGEEPDA